MSRRGGLGRNPHNPKELSCCLVSLTVWEMPAATVHAVVRRPLTSCNSDASMLCECKGSSVFANRLLCISE